MSLAIPSTWHRRWLVWGLCLAALAAECRAGDFGPNVPPSRRAELQAEAATQSSSADALWTYMQKWSAASSNPEPSAAPRLLARQGVDHPSDRQLAEARVTLDDEQSIRICAACRAFIEKFPEDRRGSEARVLILKKHGYEGLELTERRALCDQIITAPEAGTAKLDQARGILVGVASAMNWSDPEYVEKVYSEFERDYPNDKLGEGLVRSRLKYYLEKRPDEVVPMLQRLTESPNKAAAAGADRELALRTRPLELTATATDGRSVDMARLRGRVVLLYFWATWGDPDKTILPQVQALRAKYGAKDFQVLGIDLDADRSAMRKAIKAHRIDWPNLNDTVPDQGSKLAWRFGNASPQTAWVVDRAGVAHPLEPGAALEPQVHRWMER